MNFEEGDTTTLVTPKQSFLLERPSEVSEGLARDDVVDKILLGNRSKASGLGRSQF